MIENKKDLRKELIRKCIHLLELPVLLAYTLIARLYGTKPAILALTALLVILLEIEYIRLEYKLRLPLVVDILRRRERDNVASNIFFVAATIICFAAFDYQVAILALLLTVFGDLAAALVGLKFGRTRIHRRKTLEGFLAGLIVNLSIGFLLMPDQIIIFGPMALTASLVELWTGKLDDNLTVPLAAGFVGQVLFYYFQIQIAAFPGPIVQMALDWFSFLLK